MKQPAIFIPHGGGPAFFMTGSMHDLFEPMAEYLRHSLDGLAERPKAILVVTAHWEAAPIAINARAASPLVYDYYGFPPSTYEIDYPAVGSPELARQVAERLKMAGIDHQLDLERGWDHGVFIPLKVMVPLADIPLVSVSLHSGLDPLLHHRMGEALAELREEGVLVIGSGMSFHNLQHFTHSKQSSLEFDLWLDRVLVQPREQRGRDLRQWQQAPMALAAHPRSEHLLPLMVCSGAGGDGPGVKTWAGLVGETFISAWRFD